MKVLKRIVTIVVMVCVCIAFGGIKVAEAATCPPHGAKKEVGSLQYYETTKHTVEYVVDKKEYYDPLTGLIFEAELTKVENCYKTIHYSDVAEICTSCGAITDKWVEKKWWHTNPNCKEYSKEPERQRL